MRITEKPEINKDVVSMFSDVGKWAKEGIKKKLETQKDKFPTTTLIIILIVAAGAFYFLYKQMKILETPYNIKTTTKNAIDAQVQYGEDNPSRVGIIDYLKQLKKEGVPDAHLAFTNFYVSTVNASGLFFPAENGVATPEAVRAAVLGGARCFVFDIWPDLTPGAQYGPVIQTVENGSLWRRISLNYMPFGVVLKTLIQEALEYESRPGFYDPVILYLRFRGKPRMETFNLTAKTLSGILEQYRLSNMYNRCRNQDNLFSVPITDLFRKVVIASNTKADYSALADYINIGPKAGVKMEYTVNEARTLAGEAINQISVIKQNLTWVCPLSENPNSEKNDWDPQPSYDIGIMFCAMNFWNRNERLEAYMAPDMFGRQSFKIKPSKLRYVLDILPPPLDPPNPGWKSSPTAGSPNVPPALTIPV